MFRRRVLLRYSNVATDIKVNRHNEIPDTIKLFLSMKYKKQKINNPKSKSKKNGKSKLPVNRQTLEGMKKPSSIKNRQVRSQQTFKRKQLLKSIKRKERTARKKRVQRGQQEKQVPITVQDKRTFDQNFVLEEDEQVRQEAALDPFQPFIGGQRVANILLTSTPKPSTQLYDFLRQFRQLIPNTHYYPRGNYSLPQIIQATKQKQFTHLIVAREHKTTLQELLVLLLPAGPTFRFKTSSLTLNRDIDHHATWTDHIPELILKNFNSKVGRQTGRLLASMFNQSPEFRGRRVVTFHNQRDFIFLRHHRYIFDDEGKSVALQEIGPKLTLKLKEVRQGVGLGGQADWTAADKLYVRRQAVYL